MKSKLCEYPGCGKSFDEEYSGNAAYCSHECEEDHKAAKAAPLPEPPMTPESFFKITEIEIQKINLSPGDTLIVTVKNDDIHPSALVELQKQFKLVFPDNKTFILGMGTDGDVKLAVVNQPESRYDNDGCDLKESDKKNGGL